MATIKAQPGKLTQARARAQKMANETGHPVSLLHKVQVHGGKYGTGKLRTVWTTYDTVYPATTNPRRRKRITARRSPLLPAKVRVNPRTGKVQVFVSPKVAAQVKGRNPLTGSSSRIPVTLKYLIVGSNGKSYKATNLSEVNRMKRVLKNQGVTVKVVKLPKGSTTWNT